MSHTYNNTRKKVTITIAVLLITAVTIIFTRLILTDFSLDFLIPVEVFDVEITQQIKGYGDDIEMETYLPISDERQQIFEERQISTDLTFESTIQGSNRKSRFYGNNIEGDRIVKNSFRVTTKALNYKISDLHKIPLNTVVSDDSLKPHLEMTETIQGNHPEIKELAKKLMPEDRGMKVFLEKVFDYVQGLEFRPFKGTTDALTALRLGEASCNGRARLFVAIMRSQEIPARLVGGLVLTQGIKKTSHQWLEVWVNGYWVPMDPTNNHFAKIPNDYLKLYIGDKVLFKHTADVAFNYNFDIKKKLLPKQEIDQNHKVLGFWNAFSNLGVSLGFLKTLILIPLGALVVLIFRNVVGLTPFGTFLPVLIAVSAKNSGLGWGLAAFCGLILFISGIRHLLEKLQLLHAPQLTILLATVISSLLGIATLGVHFNILELSRVSLFPVAIMAITSERFAVMEIEDGRLAAYKTMLQTIIVVTACYITIDSLSLQLLFLGFPEILLIIVAVSVWIGRWTGLRLSEWLRFSKLLERKA